MHIVEACSHRLQGCFRVLEQFLKLATLIFQTKPIFSAAGTVHTSNILVHYDNLLRPKAYQDSTFIKTHFIKMH